MKRAGPDFCWLGLGVLVILLTLAVTGPVMRESDQAALLEGAVDLARSGDVYQRGWYNYDKQFLSYWFLAGVLDFTGLDAPGADPDEVVRLGNRAAAVFFSVCLLIALAAAPRRGMSSFPLALAFFLTPAVIFTVPLLSSNVLSAGCLLLLAAAMRKRRAGWWNAVLCGVLTIAAVGFRRDAALVLPLLCLLSATRFSLGGMFREARHWVMLVGAVGVVALGLLIKGAPGAPPQIFFNPLLFGAYLVFGMAGMAAIVFWMPLRLVTSRRRWFLRSITALAMLLPFGFYAGYLYTPRHFFLPAVLVLLVVILPRGELWWQVFMRRRLDRVLVWSAVVVSAGLWLVGIHFVDRSSPRLVVKDPTLYPTADGFWPMGCYRNFLIDLSRAAESPIDHNQEMWGAWTQVREDKLPLGRARVHSAGLRAYGYLALRLKGRTLALGESAGDFDLVPDRSLARRLPGFSSAAEKERDEIEWDTCWLESVGGNERRGIYLALEDSEKERSLDLPWVAQLVIVKALGPDDFHLRNAKQSAWWFQPASRGLRFAVVFSDRPAAEQFENALSESGVKPSVMEVSDWGIEAYVVAFVYRGGIPPSVQKLVKDQGLWVTRTLLPAFMSRSNY